jgi:chromosome segregation ATPase
MYILDEIDATLDLSHMQHIGQLFRTRSKGAQFIFGSLKHGLFTNANVLFKTRFRAETRSLSGRRSAPACLCGQRGGAGCTERRGCIWCI